MSRVTQGTGSRNKDRLPSESYEFVFVRPDGLRMTMFVGGRGPRAALQRAQAMLAKLPTGSKVEPTEATAIYLAADR